MKPRLFLPIAAAAISTAGFAQTPHLQPNAPRTIVITDSAPPPVVRVGLLQSTLFELPTGEKVVTVFGGDTNSWIAAHSTRDRKEIHSPSEVLNAHRQIAAEFGNQADTVVREASTRSKGQITEQTSEISQQVARQAVTFARDRSFEREAVTDERVLYRDALRRGMGETTYAEVRANFDKRIAVGELQTVPGQKHDTGRQFTMECPALFVPVGKR